MWNRIVDTVLEASIVGSFTKIGPAIRSRLDDWAPITADLSGQTMIVTGGSSGLGRETARQLLALGAKVYVTSRSLDRASAAAAELAAEANGGPCIGAELDTSEPASVAALVARLVDEVPDEIDVLIHNGGALSDTYETNSEGMERTVASHLVGPWALTVGLRPYLRSGAKVLWMSSGGMYSQGLDLSQLTMTPEDYKGAVAYARAKRAQVELVHLIGPRWAPKVITHSVHPGWAATAGVSDALPGFDKILGPLLRDPAQGADTMVWLASGGAADESVEPGQFWHDRRPRGTNYLPGTGTTEGERLALLAWLNDQVDA